MQVLENPLRMHVGSDEGEPPGDTNLGMAYLSKGSTYDHLYRWSPPGDIKHFLVLHNNTDTPWTTGPCLATTGGNALSEDLLKYVPSH
jgi:hypothetical protein